MPACGRRPCRGPIGLGVDPRSEHDDPDLPAVGSLSGRWGARATRSSSPLGPRCERSAVGSSRRASSGAGVRWAEVAPGDRELPVGQYDDLLLERTPGSVAVTAASNVLGTRARRCRHRLPRRTDQVRLPMSTACIGRLMGPSTLPPSSLGADFYATSAYKWSGAGISERLIGRTGPARHFHPDKLAPSSDAVPGDSSVGRRAFADLAGVVAAVEHLASLVPARTGSAARTDPHLDGGRRAVRGCPFPAALGRAGAMGHVTLYGDGRSPCSRRRFSMSPAGRRHKVAGAPRRAG